MRTAWRVVRDTVAQFIDDDATTYGAALAFYTALSMAPLLVLLLWIASLAGESIQRELTEQIQGLVGPEGGAVVSAIIKNAEATPGLGTFAGIVSLATLLFSVSGVFGQLQYTLNRIWNVTPAPGGGMTAWLHKRLLSLGTFVSVGFLLVVSLVASAAVSALVEHAGSPSLAHVTTFAVSFAVTTVVFALVFKVLPDVRIGWSETWVGAVATAALFSIGRVAIGLYLGRSSVASAYGAAGSLVVLLLWVYYASLILFAGAEITQAVAKRLGHRIDPEPHAVPTDESGHPAHA